MIRDDSEKVEILLERYSQVDRNHQHHNQILHTTFYLSVIFFGALLSISLSLDEGNRIIISALSFFSGGILLLLGLWTRTYLNGRSEIQKRKRLLVEELSSYYCSFNNLRNIGETYGFFERDAKWEFYKDQLLLLYYYALSAIAFSISAWTSFNWLQNSGTLQLLL